MWERCVFFVSKPALYDPTIDLIYILVSPSFFFPSTNTITTTNFLSPPHLPLLNCFLLYHLLGSTA